MNVAHAHAQLEHTYTFSACGTLQYFQLCEIIPPDVVKHEELVQFFSTTINESHGKTGSLFKCDHFVDFCE